MDDQPPPVAAWVVLLAVIDELAGAGDATSTRVGLEAQRRTGGRVGRQLTHVTRMLRQLEAAGAVASSRPTNHASLAWRLTDEGRWFLRTARTAVRLALRRDFRRRGGDKDGGTRERQRRGQRRGQR